MDASAAELRATSRRRGCVQDRAMLRRLDVGGLRAAAGWRALRSNTTGSASRGKFKEFLRRYRKLAQTTVPVSCKNYTMRA